MSALCVLPKELPKLSFPTLAMFGFRLDTLEERTRFQAEARTQNDEDYAGPISFVYDELIDTL